MNAIFYHTRMYGKTDGVSNHRLTSVKIVHHLFAFWCLFFVRVGLGFDLMPDRGLFKDGNAIFMFNCVWLRGDDFNEMPVGAPGEFSPRLS